MTRASPARVLVIGLSGLLGLAGAACGGASATPAPPPSILVEAVPLAITAQDIELTPATMVAEPGVPLQITFDNKDAGIPHNLVLKAGPTLATELIKSEIVTGPATLQLAVPGLVPGVYGFTCNVHPNMATTLTVGG